MLVYGFSNTVGLSSEKKRDEKKKNPTYKGKLVVRSIFQITDRSVEKGLVFRFH